MNKKLTVAEGIVELMSILGEAPVKEAVKAVEVEIDSFGPGAAYRRSQELTEEYVPVTRVTKISNAPAKEVAAKAEPKVKPVDVVYGHSGAIKVGDKKVHTGPKKKGGPRGPKADPVKDSLKDIYVALITESKAYGANTFTHSTEGFVIRMEEADYTIKVTKSKVNKFELEEGESADVEFISRGKVKNSAPGIARALYIEIENQISNSNLDFKIVDAKASGITLQGAAGEYTIKISKKRERVGFEAERADVYKNAK